MASINFSAADTTNSMDSPGPIPACGTRTAARSLPSRPMSTTPVVRGPRWIPKTKVEWWSTCSGTRGRPWPPTGEGMASRSLSLINTEVMFVTDAALRPSWAAISDRDIPGWWKTCFITAAVFRRRKSSPR